MIQQNNNKIPVYNNRIRIRDIRDAIPTSGLWLHYDAKSTACYPRSGTTVYDLSGNGRNATLMGSIGFTEANYGSFVLDGSPDYIKSANTMPFATQSYSVWVYSTALVSKGILETGNVGLLQSNAPYLLFSSINNSGWKFAAYHIVTQYAYIGTFAANTWYNITITRTNASGTGNAVEKVYINGVLLNTRTTAYLSNAAGQINFGVGFQGYWVGNIPIMIVYDKILSDTEILQIYNAYKYRF